MTHSFMVGSSIASTFVTLLYLGYAFRRARRPADVPFEMIAVGVPIAYGLANMLNVQFGNTVWSAAFVGAMLGLMFSLVGRFLFAFPRKLFGFNIRDTPKVHIIAPILYMIIFVVIIRNLN